MREDDLELLRRGYHALGPGVPGPVLDLFEQRGQPPARWCVVDVVDSGRTYAARDVVARDLFGGVPDHWEVTAARIISMRVLRPRRGATHVAVLGRYSARPHGSWDALEVPFAHVWTLRDGHPERVLSYLEGVELQRLPADPEAPRQRLAGGLRSGSRASSSRPQTRRTGRPRA